VRIEFESGTFQLFYLYFVFRWRIVFCLSHGVQVAGAAWCAAMRIMVVEDLVQRTGDGRTGRVLSGRAIERSGDTVCGLHHAHGDEKRGFLGLLSLKTKVATFFSGLASKPVATVFSGLASKLVATISPGLASKPVATVW
jgi:hypothetical protein